MVQQASGSGSTTGTCTSSTDKLFLAAYFLMPVLIVCTARIDNISTERRNYCIRRNYNSTYASMSQRIKRTFYD
jgi:hypothetical protein